LEKCKEENEILSNKIISIKDDLHLLNEKNKLLNEKSSNNELKRKLSDERIDEVMNELTESFKRNKMLELKIISLNNTIDENNLLNENKKQEIISLKNKIMKLEEQINKLIIDKNDVQFQEIEKNIVKSEFNTNEDFILLDEDNLNTLLKIEEIIENETINSESISKKRKLIK
jgi:hypothetical protein